jgi:hypothetical protein
MTHTPTPWKVEIVKNGGEWDYQIRTNIDNQIPECGKQIASTHKFLEAKGEHNAEFIVHAVNCHDELMEALKVAKYALADGWTEASTKATKESIENAIKITTKAIQEAEGKP